MEGIVETSSSLAAVEHSDELIRITTSSRSSSSHAMERVLSAIDAAGMMANVKVETKDGYPGWKPDLESNALSVLVDVYTEIWDREPEVTAVHAGLECGLLGRKVQGMDMISFGPQIEGAHSPDERVHIGSVALFWSALCRALEKIATPQ
jgi:dipeptidase D